jgi:RNA polymerase sigma factor FliA
VETNLKAIELKDLWRRYKADADPQARERLVLAYSPLVKYVAGRMATGLPSHVEEADLISYGLLGLISAIERFEPEREIKFETFAITRIKGSIIDELRSLDWVPRSVRSKAREIEKVNAKLEHELHRAPTDQEMAQALHVSVEDLQDSLVRISNSSVVALDELWTVSDSSGDQVSLLDTIQDPAALDPATEMDTTEMKDRLADAIARLPEREKLVVALYYYENLTLREIGEVLGVTESRVSQLHTKAVLRLKSRLQGEPATRRWPASHGTRSAAHRWTISSKQRCTRCARSWARTSPRSPSSPATGRNSSCAPGRARPDTCPRAGSRCWSRTSAPAQPWLPRPSSAISAW